MTAIAASQQQLQQDLQNELTTANQLLQLINIELQQIKHMTSSGGELEANIQENSALIAALANIQQINIDNLPQMERKQINMSHYTNENISYEHHDSFRNASDMEDSR